MTSHDHRGRFDNDDSSDARLSLGADGQKLKDNILTEGLCQKTEIRWTATWVLLSKSLSIQWGLEFSVPQNMDREPDS